jgi:hypothetical protein
MLAAINTSTGPTCGSSDSASSRRFSHVAGRYSSGREFVFSQIGNHTFRATGITAYLKNNGTLEHAQHLANHESPRTTKLYDRRAEEISLDEVEKISI